MTTKKGAKKPAKKPAKKKKPAPPPPAPGPARGATRMRQQGYRQVPVWLDEVEIAGIKKAADAMKVPVATFLRRAGYKAALDVFAELGMPKPDLLARAEV